MVFPAYNFFKARTYSPFSLFSLTYKIIQTIKTKPAIKLPPRPPAQDYERPPRELFHQVPDHAGTLLDQITAEKVAKKASKADKS